MHRACFVCSMGLPGPGLLLALPGLGTGCPRPSSHLPASLGWSIHQTHFTGEEAEAKGSK